MDNKDMPCMCDNPREYLSLRATLYIISPFCMGHGSGVIRCWGRSLQECKAQQHKLSEKTLSMETHSRRENLKFDGIKESRGEDCFKTIKQTLIAMDEEFEIISLDRVHRLGPYKPNRESDPRTVIVKFTHYVDRERVWSKRNSLKGTHTWVKEDYPREIEQRRKKLWPFLRAARAGDPSNPDNRVTAHLRID